MLTEEQKQRRRAHVCSSDVPAILGLSPFQTAYDIWLNKTKGIEPIITNDAVDIGNYLEDDIVDWTARQLFIDYETYPDDPDRLEFISKDNPLMMAHLDADVVDEDAAIEAKYTSMADEWGYMESDIPQRVYIQNLIQLYCTGYERIYVGVWISSINRMERRFYTLQKDEKTEKHIAEVVSSCTKWWQTYVVKGIEPPIGQYQTPDAFKQIKPIPDKKVDLSKEAWTEYLEAKKAENEAKQRRQSALSKVLAEKGDAEAGVIPDGSGSWFEYAEEPTGKGGTRHMPRVRKGRQ